MKQQSAVGLAEWAARAQAGNDNAREELLRQARPCALAWAAQILPDRTLAEDAAQEALIEVAANLHRVREAKAFPAFLRRVVHKHCDRLTRRKALTIVPADGWHEIPAPHEQEPAHVWEAAQNKTAARLLLNRLTPREREAMVCFYWEEQSLTQIAQTLNTSASTVKSRLHEARQRLRKELSAMNNKNENDQAQQIARTLYDRYTAAFARRDANGILNLYAPDYQLHLLRWGTKNYDWVASEVRWEMNAGFPEPRQLRFTIELAELEPETNAVPRRIVARVRCQRFGKAVKEGAAIRRDIWETRSDAPHGYALVETRVLVV